jgi:protein-tyrosine sulfotransferase
MAFSDENYDPIFILSCERSGSTLLRIIVDSHPEIACPGQLYLGQSCESLYKTVYYSLGQRFQGSEAERQAYVLNEVRGLVGGVVERYAAARNKRIWCEKTTLNVEYLDILSSVFPNAKYLCLYRNCMDVVQSCLKFSTLGFMGELAPYVCRDPGNLVGAMAESWLDKNRRILDFESKYKSKCFRVIYEDLTREPSRSIREMFRFLGVNWDDENVGRIFSTEHDHGEGDLKVHFSKEISKDSVGKGRSIPLTAITDQMQLRINEMNECLGYEPLNLYYKDLDGSQSRPQQTEVLDLNSFFEARSTEILASRRSKYGNLRGACRLVVEGERGGSWTINLSGGDTPIQKGGRDLPADCTIAITHSAFCDLVRGEASVGEVYERGQVSVRGPEHLALQFGMLLFG